MSSLIPVGFRFAPTEEELITDYLRRKVEGEPLPWSGVIERDIYEKAPWDVFMKNDPWNSFKITKDKWEHVIYVFTKLKKTGNSKKRISRRAGTFGTWNAQTGIDRILNEQKQHIGYKKMLVFEADFKKEEYGLMMPPGHWIMYEYSLGGLSLNGLQLQDHDDDYVLCKIKRDDSKCLKRAPKHDQGHGAAIVDIGYSTDIAGCLSKTSDEASKTENPTHHKKMRYEASSTTPHNFNVCMQHQYHYTLYDQSLSTMGDHQLLPTQESQCSILPNNRSFDATSMPYQQLQMQEYHYCLYNQTVTIDHQQRQCSSPSNNRPFDATATPDQSLPALENTLFDPPNITMNSSCIMEEPIESFFDDIDFLQARTPQ